jgi:Protein of unknown function (DUF3108)
MKINKILILLLIVIILSVTVLIIHIDNNSSKKEADIYNYAAERILYVISPLGRSEYQNLGLVDLNGLKVNLITLRTKVLLIDDLERIYSDPVSLLPLKIERTICKFWGKDYKTEEYDQKKFTVVVRKFEGKKLIKEQIIKADGPIQNVILLLFYLRNYVDLKIGWNFIVQVPDEFKPELASIKLELVSIDQISVPAGKFQAYHFKTIPNKFEFWVNKDNPRVPLKIKIKSILDFNVLMKKYNLNNKFSRIEAKP